MNRSPSLHLRSYSHFHQYDGTVHFTQGMTARDDSIFTPTPDISEARVILWNKRRTMVLCPRCSRIHEYAGTALADYSDPPIYAAPSVCRNIYQGLLPPLSLPSSTPPFSPLVSLGDPAGISTIYVPKYPTYYEVGDGYDEDPYPFFYSPSWLHEAVQHLPFHSTHHLTGAGGGQQLIQDILDIDSDDPNLHLINMETGNGKRWDVRLEKNDRLIESWRVTARGKTFSILFRGKGLLPICSESGASGKSRSESHHRCATISRKEYTRYGLQRSRIEGYTLPQPVQHEEKKHGEWHAGHAEMQLMHWFIKKNLANLYDPGNSSGYQELRAIQPPWRCPVVILASLTPCSTCNAYARHIESKYPVQLVLRPQQSSSHQLVADG